MSFQSLIIETSVAFGVFSIIAIIGLIIWWLIRKRQNHVWLPTVRILDLNTRRLPKLRLTPPPFLAFLCFLIVALVITGFMMRPREQIFTPFEPNQTRLHVFVDMSLSVSKNISISEYSGKIGDLWNSLQSEGRITYSTSHSEELFEAKSRKEVESKIAELGFHRAGLRLGAALKKMLDGLGEVDRLFIVSDKDQHSWTGFNWRYLMDEIDVRFVDTERGSAWVENVFINDARYQSSPTSATMDWEIEIARRGTAREVGGDLTVEYRGQKLAEISYHIPLESEKITLKVGWPISTVKGFTELENSKGDPLIWRLLPSSADAIEQDNEFRTALLGFKQEGILITESSGEQTINDPSYQLQIALEVQGFRLNRIDTLKQPGPQASKYGFWIIMGGQGHGIENFCPNSVSIARLKKKDRQGAKNLYNSDMPRVWLAPFGLHADYRELCQCYSKLLIDSSATAAPPAYCDDVTSRELWTELLPSLGAKQVGGELGENSGALAWLGSDASSGLQVTTFTVPLRPMMQTGINHAMMPVLVKELLTWQGVLANRFSKGSESWPRVMDITEVLWKNAAEKPHPKVSTTNVPLGESLLSSVSAEQLPEQWTPSMSADPQKLAGKKDREDPLPWLKLGLILITAALAAEALWIFSAKLYQLMGRRRETWILAFLIAGFAMVEGRAISQVTVNAVGYSKSTKMYSLSREVSQRTSIELDRNSVNFFTLNSKLLVKPWIWVKNRSAITEADGSLKKEIVFWLKRGGFLILEDIVSSTQLDKLTNKAFKYAPRAPMWQSIPPDHELMRSFYLLDALPACKGQVWQGFHFDGRLAIVAIPYGFLSTLKDSRSRVACKNAPSFERSVRVFVNLLMVSLATDYKKDQIHLPEILKRLR